MVQSQDDDDEDNCIDLLAHAIANNSGLTSLSLWRCGIGPEGGKAICNAVTNNTNLISVEIGYNDFDHSDVLLMTKQLEINRGARALRLSQEAELAREKERKSQEELMAKREQEKEDQNLKWLEEQKFARAELRQLELERQQQETQKEEEKRQQMKHIQKMEEERSNAASKKSKKGKYKKGKKKKLN